MSNNAVCIDYQIHIQTLTEFVDGVVVVLHSLGQGLLGLGQFVFETLHHPIVFGREIKLAIIEALDGCAEVTTHFLEFL